MAPASTRREVGSRQTEQPPSRTLIPSFHSQRSFWSWQLSLQPAQAKGHWCCLCGVVEAGPFSILSLPPGNPFLVWSPHTLPLTCFLSLTDPLCSLQFQVRELRRGQEPARWFGCAGSSCGGKLELRCGFAPELLGPRVQRRA